jgi:hypothetical protein
MVPTARTPAHRMVLHLMQVLSLVIAITTREDGTTLPGSCFGGDFQPHRGRSVGVFLLLIGLVYHHAQRGVSRVRQEVPQCLGTVLAQATKCEEATSKQAECGAGRLQYCKWSASATCEYDVITSGN